MQCDSRLVGKLIRDCEIYAGHFAFTTPWLKPGQYRVDLFICGGDHVIDFWENACSIIISPLFPYSHSANADGMSDGLVLADFSWSDRNGVRATPLATSSSF